MASTSTTTTTRSGSIAGVMTRTLIVSVLCLLTVVICTAAHEHAASQDESRAARYGRTSETQPAKCSRYYNDGTDQWVRCMGVEPK